MPFKPVLLRLLLACFFCGATAAYCATPLCSSETLENKTYLIAHEDFPRVLEFFKNLPENHLKNLEGFSSFPGRQQKLVKYYDFSDLSLLNAGFELTVSKLKNLPEFRDDKTTIVFSNNNSLPATQHKITAKLYNRRASAVDRHPLLGMVHRKQRQLLFDHIKSVNEQSPLKLEATLTTQQDESVYLTSHYGIPYASITLSSLRIDNFGTPSTHTLLQFAFHPINKTPLTAEELPVLSKSYCNIQQDFSNQFPHLYAYQHLGYAELFSLAETALPTRRFLYQNPLIFNIAQILVLAAFGFLVLYIPLKKNRGKTIKQMQVISKTSHNKS